MALDRFRKAIKRLAEEPSLRYYGLYPYKVAGVNTASGATLMDLVSEAEGMPDLTNIQWLMPIGANSFSGIANNSTLRVLVGFIEGDPTKPYALPNFLSGMVENLIQSTGTYTHNTLGTNTTNASGTNASNGNIIENASNTAVAGSGGNIQMNASAGGASATGGNIQMNASASGLGGNITATASRKIRLDPGEDVVVANGGRYVARMGDFVDLDLEAHVVDPLSGTLPVIFTKKSATISQGTSKIKVP